MHAEQVERSMRPPEVVDALGASTTLTVGPPTDNSGAVTESDPPNALRAARAVRGWSLTTQAHQIVDLGRGRGLTVATVASLRSQISRWENGHAVPDPQYRELLSDLLGRSPSELGIGGGAAPGGDPASRLRASVSAAAAVDDGVLQLWREHLASARRLDDELGATGAGSVVRAQVDQLEETLVHTVDAAARARVAGVLSAAAELAGAQAFDGGEPDEAWRRYARARSAAVEADDPAAAAVATAGLAAVLVDVGDPAGAITLLTGPRPDAPAPALARLAAALGEARAARGDTDAAHAAVAEARRLATPAYALDVVFPSGPPIEVADFPRWRGHVLTRLQDAEAVPVLREALEAGPRAVRHRAALHADLAAALLTVDGPGSVEQARTARALAERIGSARIATAVKSLTGGGR